jgi:pumilio RNA-binding family
MKGRLVNELSRNILKISSHNYGCKVVQKAFDICALPARKKMSEDVINKANLSKFITDQNANHVVQKIIEKG